MRPQLPLLNTERLITWAFLALVIVLGITARKDARYYRAIAEARPAIKERVIFKRVQGPTRVEVRTITKPGGEKIVERIRFVERSETSNRVEREETPICVSPDNRAKAAPWRYARVAFDPAWGWKPRSAAVGVTWRNFLDVGATADWHYDAVGLEAGIRW